MTPTAHHSQSRDVLSPEAAAFLSELARLPAVQEGDLDAVADLVCRRAADLVDARYFSIWMLDATRSHVSSVVRYDSESGKYCPEIQLPIEQVVDELAALGRNTHIVSDDALADPRLIGIHDSYLREQGVVSLLEHAIRVAGNDIGLVSFERTAQGSAWHDGDIALARGLSSYLALTAGNQQRLVLERRVADTAALQAAILENAAYAVIATNIDGTITFFNRAAERMLGYRSDELVNKVTPAVFHDPQEVEARALQFSKELKIKLEPGFGVFTAKTLAGQRNEDEWIYVRRDGSRFTVLLSITAMRGANGAIEGFLAIASDVTERNLVSSRLRQSEEMLSRVLLQSPDSILITALVDGRILEVNPGFEQITGYSRAEAIGRTTVDLNIWFDLDERNTMISQVRGAGEVRSMPIRISRRGKEIRHCILWGRTFDFNGIPALLTSVHDVTDIKEAEQKARMAQHMLQVVLDTVPGHVFWKDKNSVYLGSNRQFAVDNGFASAAEIIGTTDYDQLRNPTPQFVAEIDQVIEADRRIIATKETSTPRNVPFVLPDNSLRWMTVVKRPLLDDNGEVVGVLGVQHDITEQLRSQEQLRASEEKLRSLFALSPLGINLQDMSGRYLDTNEAFLSIVGYTREELLGETCYALIPPEYLDGEPGRLSRLRETGLIPAYEKSYIRKDGTRVPVSTSTVLVSGPDGQDFKWTIVEDITIRLEAREAQRKLNDELERLVAERTAELQSAIEGLMRAEKLASLGSLVAGVAHEISTPVGNASLATSTLVGAIGDFETQLAGKLSRSTLDGFVRQVKLGVDIANRNIERVAGLIQSFKQVAVDQTSSQRRTFLMSEIVDEILTTMHPSLKRGGVSTNATIEPTLKLDSYPGPLGQILTNLINNAIIHAFRKDGAPDTATAARRITIGARVLDEHNIRLEIKDNGVGIPVGALGRIFDPFYTSKLGQGGSGLGLHIVHNIVTDVLAGTISVESELGVGTTFVITMPRVTPRAAVIATDEANG